MEARSAVAVDVAVVGRGLVPRRPLTLNGPTPPPWAAPLPEARRASGDPSGRQGRGKATANGYGNRRPLTLPSAWGRAPRGHAVCLSRLPSAPGGGVQKVATSVARGVSAKPPPGPPTRGGTRPTAALGLLLAHRSRLVPMWKSPSRKPPSTQRRCDGLFVEYVHCRKRRQEFYQLPEGQTTRFSHVGLRKPLLVVSVKSIFEAQSGALYAFSHSLAGRAPRV